MTPATILVGLALAAVVAAICDVTTRRVPNLLSFGIIVSACIARGTVDGWTGALVAGATVLGMLLLGVLAFERRWLGGGDIKLAAGLAGGFGPTDVLALLIYTGVAGGFLAAFWALRERRLGTTAFHLAHGVFANLPLVIPSTRRGVPYAVAIAIGANLVALSHTALPSLRIVL